MSDGDTVLVTSRLRLVPATSTMITAELEHPDGLAEVLGAELAVDWPPEHHDRDTLRFWREELERPGAAGWWLHYALHVRRGVRSTLVGSVGYKGPPKDGVVEIGYSVVPSWQRQGLATEACLALIESAWRRGATAVVAHTLDGLEPSIGVLRKLGFVASASSEPGALAFTLRRREGHHDVR
ncbi:MAG: GNAT family N-acetyltransferase [Solirubrobacterales bacterium]|nr:GNAT family N-acetyltransferase [Solirubrobacterales bacterium]